MEVLSEIGKQNRILFFCSEGFSKITSLEDRPHS